MTSVHYCLFKHIIIILLCESFQHPSCQCHVALTLTSFYLNSEKVTNNLNRNKKIMLGYDKLTEITVFS